jgi:hypothetical protein
LPTASEPFDPCSLLQRLAAADVDFVVIGAVAGAAHGSSYGTFDVDIAFADEPENLGRLSAALADVGSDRPFEARAFSYHTSLGHLKCFANPSGAPRYGVLRANAWPIEVGRSTVRIASLDHLIAMKEAAGRPRDQVMAMEYRTLSDELRAPRGD